MQDRPVVIASNRGPLTFSVDTDGALRARRGAGGLVSGIGPLVAGTETTWVAAAMSDGDRRAATEGVTSVEDFRIRMLDLDPYEHRAAYDVVCNGTLWFLHHGLFDLARRPRFDLRWRESWDAYRSVNRAFAAAIAEVAPTGAAVLVQDYHLALLGPLLEQLRGDLATVHFSHTPFAGPDLMRVLPSEIGRELLEGMTGHRSCGFHAERWAAAFRASCRDLLGDEPSTFVTPLASDAAELEELAGSDACTRALESLEREIAGRALIVRVDRIELSKNLLRGFLAFDHLLERHPRWQGRVSFGAFVYPSREGLPEYLAYRQEVETTVERINERWGTPDWQPILLDTTDDFARSLAALRRYDVLLVNPIRDGLNLVAKEGPIVNEHDGVLALSPEAGAWAELGAAALRVEPFDIVGTAERLAEALAMDPSERRAHSRAVRSLAVARQPSDWLTDLRAAAG